MNEHKAPSIEAARKMGETGGPAVEAERLAFEAWMSGHCWSVGDVWWDGRGYISPGENAAFVDPVSRRVRQLWAAWRDRAALARMAGDGQAKEAEHLRQECKLLADVLRDAYEVIKTTVEGENSDEDERLCDLRMTIEAALSGYDQDRIAMSAKQEAAE